MFKGARSKRANSQSYRERGCIASQLTSNLKHSLDIILFKDNENLQYLLWEVKGLFTYTMLTCRDAAFVLLMDWDVTNKRMEAAANILLRSTQIEEKHKVIFHSAVTRPDRTFCGIGPPAVRVWIKSEMLCHRLIRQYEVDIGTLRL